MTANGRSTPSPAAPAAPPSHPARAAAIARTSANAPSTSFAPERAAALASIRADCLASARPIDARCDRERASPRRRTSSRAPRGEAAYVGGFEQRFSVARGALVRSLPRFPGPAEAQREEPRGDRGEEREAGRGPREEERERDELRQRAGGAEKAGVEPGLQIAHMVRERRERTGRRRGGPFPLIFVS